MIFLSHNWKDKVLVEPVALRLAEIFGEANVFYDSWSIQPGDGIIEKMNAGLGAADLFFFFVSANSLASKMVSLEWQNALMKVSSGKLRLIPVRLDATLLPPILMQTVYLDLYTYGLETTLRQIVDIAKGGNVFSPQHSGFHNVTASVATTGDKVLIAITASHYMEPRCRFLVLTHETQEQATVAVPSETMFTQGYNPAITLSDGLKCAAFLVGLESALIPKFPLRIEFKNTAPGKLPSFLGLLHQKAEERWEPVPTTPA